MICVQYVVIFLIVLFTVFEVYSYLLTYQPCLFTCIYVTLHGKTYLIEIAFKRLKKRRSNGRSSSVRMVFKRVQNVQTLVAFEWCSNGVRRLTKWRSTIFERFLNGV